MSDARDRRRLRSGERFDAPGDPGITARDGVRALQIDRAKAGDRAAGGARTMLPIRETDGRDRIAPATLKGAAVGRRPAAESPPRFNR